MKLTLFIIFTDKVIRRKGIATVFQTKRHEILAADMTAARDLAVEAHRGSQVSMSWPQFPQSK